MDLTNKRILVTGGAGFLGRYVVGKLGERGCKEIIIPRSQDYNLIEMKAVERLYRDSKPDIVIHLAAKAKGIGATSEKPGEFFYDNLMMDVQMMEQGRRYGIEKFVAVGTVCAYPENIPVPFKEEDLWNGYPEKTNAPYGLAKKMVLVQAQAYKKQYGFNAIYLLPVNLYGPGDNFDLKTGRVIPALIRKCLDAIEEGKEEIIAWGTGEPGKGFLYVEDAAEGIVLATEKYNNPDPVNLSSGFEISIKDLANSIAKLTGYNGRIIWDTSKPDGQLRGLYASYKAEKEFGFKAKMSFEEGLKKTIEWYKEQRKRIIK